jgi:hypothetical protein
MSDRFYLTICRSNQTPSEKRHAAGAGLVPEGIGTAPNSDPFPPVFRASSPGTGSFPILWKKGGSLMMKINTRAGRRTQPGIEIVIRPVKQAEGEYTP